MVCAALLHGAGCCPVLEKALSWNFLFAGNTFLLESTFSFLFNGILHLSRLETCAGWIPQILGSQIFSSVSSSLRSSNFSLSL